MVKQTITYLTLQRLTLSKESTTSQVGAVISFLIFTYSPSVQGSFVRPDAESNRKNLGWQGKEKFSLGWCSWRSMPTLLTEAIMRVIYWELTMHHIVLCLCHVTLSIIHLVLSPMWWWARLLELRKGRHLCKHCKEHKWKCKPSPEAAFFCLLDYSHMNAEFSTQQHVKLLYSLKYRT